MDKALDNVEAAKNCGWGTSQVTNISFNELLSKVAPLIMKEDTMLRDSICPAERLAVTLRFLAPVL
jgi:hypothetical protein